MNRVALAIASFLAVAGVLAGAYFAAPYAGFRVDLSMIVAAAAMLAAACSVAVLALVLTGRQSGGRAYASTKLREDPVWQFISPFKGEGAIQLLARPGLPVDVMVMRHERVLGRPSDHPDQKIVLTIKKAKRGGEMFNPVVLKALFEKLKPFAKSEHVILVNEHDEFMGYVPWANAIKEFTGDNAETKIGKNIVE